MLRALTGSGIQYDPKCGNAGKQSYLKFYNEQIKTSTAVAAANRNK
jgi:hypothetical protein